MIVAKGAKSQIQRGQNIYGASAIDKGLGQEYCILPALLKINVY